MSQQMQSGKAAFSIEEVVAVTGIKRSKLYLEIKAGRLQITKCGTRTLILPEALQRWLNSLPKT